MANLVVDLLRECLGSELAILNAGTLRADRTLGPGMLTMRQLVSLLPMADETAVLRLSGAAVLAALENGVSQYPRLDGRWPCVSQIRFQFDPSRPPGSRVLPGSVFVSAAAAPDAATPDTATPAAAPAAATPAAATADVVDSAATPASPPPPPPPPGRRATCAWSSATASRISWRSSRPMRYERRAPSSRALALWTCGSSPRPCGSSPCGSQATQWPCGSSPTAYRCRRLGARRSLGGGRLSRRGAAVVVWDQNAFVRFSFLWSETWNREEDRCE